MPCNYSFYPPNWKEIVAEKKRKYHNKCELCYAPNGVTVDRFDIHSGCNHPWWHTSYIGKHTKIVLTVHHIDCDKSNNTDQNLILLCQKCHLRLDLDRHMKNRKRNKEFADKMRLDACYPDIYKNVEGRHA